MIRTLKLGHLFTQGTVDSNEVWLDVTVTSGDRVIGRSGALDPQRGNEVDPWSHFVNVFMLDKDGNRIDRRNPQDIFTPLYNHQIPPGAGQTVHYELAAARRPRRAGDRRGEAAVPQVRPAVHGLRRARTTNQKARRGQERRFAATSRPGRISNELPITTLAVDRVTFPVAGVDADVSKTRTRHSALAALERLRHRPVARRARPSCGRRPRRSPKSKQLNRWDGPMNLARVYNAEGRLDEAVAALQRADAYQRRAKAIPRWTWAWLSGDINRQQGRLTEAIVNLRSVLEDRTADMQTARLRLQLRLRGDQPARADAVRPGPAAGAARPDTTRRATAWQEAVDTFQQTLAIDSENVTAHHNLQLLYAELGDTEKSREHEQLHLRYKPDDNAQGRAERLARERYPAANHAAEAVVKYPLQRPGAPGLEPGARSPAARESCGRSAPCRRCKPA